MRQTSLRVLDSLWRAMAYCLMPKVIFLTLLPVILMLGMVWGMTYFFWEAATDAVTNWVQSFDAVNWVLTWLEGWGLLRIRAVFAPALVLFISVPIIVMGSLYLAAVFVMPLSIRLVSKRRFPNLHRHEETAWWRSLLWAAWNILIAFVLLVMTMPFWLIPPLALLLPALIWGWLTCRVMSHDALVDHASHSEQVELMNKHRYPLLFMGVMTGLLGAAPTILWASTALFVVMAPVFVPLAIWLYVLTFAFASLWFAHYCLHALDELRKEDIAVQAREVFPETPLIESQVK